MKNSRKSRHYSQKSDKSHKNRSKKTHSNKPVAKVSLYGLHAVRAAWLNPAREVGALYITAQCLSGFEATIKDAKKADLRRPEPIVTDKNSIDKACPKGAVHQGIALECKDLDDVFLQDIIIGTKTQQNALVVILDQVTDPHNVGAILRSACAFGAVAVVMQRKTAPQLTGVLAKTASGAVEHIDVVLETNLSRCIESLQQDGFFVYGLDERGEQTPRDIKAGGKVALVLGAEGPGLRHLVREHCDSLLKLPTTGALSSLNVSNAAAVALYALSE